MSSSYSEDSSLEDASMNADLSADDPGAPGESDDGPTPSSARGSLTEVSDVSGAETGPSPLGRLHVITDFKLQQRLSHAELARLALRGGADTIQFRQKHGGIRNILEEARKTQAACLDASRPMIVNDRVDVAEAVGAEGVHLGQKDFPIGDARQLLGPDAIIGATANHVEQAIAAEEGGATYIGFGPVFETRSKRNPKSIVGLDVLARACDALSIPVIAIGGITHDRVRPTLAAGAHGVAVLSAVATSKNPERAAARFRAAIDGALRASQ